MGPLQSVLVLAGIMAGLMYHNFCQNKCSLRDLATSYSGASRPIPKGNAMHKLFTPVIHSINVDYTDPAGRTYERPNSLTWKHALGERILIVDIDTRMPDGDNELLGQKQMQWESHVTKGGGLVSNGIMDHFLYAQVHGYDYKHFHAQYIDGYHATWIKPHVLASLLKDYDFVIFLDADVTVTHMDVPMEWLFNRWNITSRTSIAMPWDVEHEKPVGVLASKDSKGQQVLNTGFIILQNLPLTFEMLQAWAECPTEKRYKGCAHWKTEWSHEQRAFSEHVRYDYNPDGDNIVSIACDDAVAWPGASQEPNSILSDCNGNFLRHHTLSKERSKAEFQDSVMQLVTQLLQKQVAQDTDTILHEEYKSDVRRS